MIVNVPVWAGRNVPVGQLGREDASVLLLPSLPP